MKLQRKKIKVVKMWKNLKIWPILAIIIFSSNIIQIEAEEEGIGSNSISKVFSPIVTATCSGGTMTVKVETLDNFLGVVQSRDYRKPQCSGYGENARVTLLRINMLAGPDDPDYCGGNQGNDEFSVAVAVRLHRTLELANDKFYMITCGKAGFQNTRNETSTVNLELLRGQNRVQHVVYGEDYTLRAHFSQPDAKIGMKVKRCFSFSDTNNTVQLVDDRGCPVKEIMSEFRYNAIGGTAEAQLYSMFKFPDSNRVHFQCHILVCRGRCPAIDCDEDEAAQQGGKQGRSLTAPSSDALLQVPQDGAVMASYSVFVVDPGEKVDALAVCENCSEWKTNVLFYLCIAFGILFLVMLLVNLYLCCAMTSTPIKRKSSGYSSDTMVSTQRKKNDKPEEFDPYAHARSWHGSQYGSRYSLNGGGLKPVPVPFIPVTENSNRGPARLHHHHQLNGVLVAPGLASAPVSSRPPSRTRQRSRSRSKSRARSKPKHRPTHQSYSSGQSGDSTTQFSQSGSTGRLVVSSGPDSRH